MKARMNEVPRKTAVRIFAAVFGIGILLWWAQYPSRKGMGQGAKQIQEGRQGPDLAQLDPVLLSSRKEAGSEKQRALGGGAVFLENLGQWEGDFRYRAVLGRAAMFLWERGWWLSWLERMPGRKDLGPESFLGRGREEEEEIRGVALRFRFLGGAVPAELEGEDRVSGEYNFFLGKDPEKWVSGVSGFRVIRGKGLYPGIDFRMREGNGGFEYDLVLAPGADLGQVVLQVEGTEGLRLDERGDLILETALGPVRQPAPVAWEEGEGGARPVRVGYVFLGGGKFGFHAADWRGSSRLWIDPGLQFSTFFGGNPANYFLPVVRNQKGELFSAGFTTSPVFPSTPGAFQVKSNGKEDAVIVCMDPTGSRMVFSTFFGGKGDDIIYNIKLGKDGRIVFLGRTWSPDLPTTPGAWDRIFNNNGNPSIFEDCFVGGLDGSGKKLLFSSYFGGGSGDSAGALALEPGGTILVAGGTYSLDFPTTSNAWSQTYLGGAEDGFLARFDAKVSRLEYSSYLGGKKLDFVYSVGLGVKGVIYLCGITSSPGFPVTTGALCTSYQGGYYDAFLTRFDPKTMKIFSSTFLGGNGADRVFGQICFGSNGSVFVGGYTASRDFPTTPGAWDRTYNGGSGHIYDAFVARLDPSLKALIFSTYLGAPGLDRCYGLAVDAQGRPLLVGHTYSPDFPTTPCAWDRKLRTTGSTWGRSDGFVAYFDSMGRKLLYSTLLGGKKGYDFPISVTFDGKGRAVVVGSTCAPDFPTTPGAWNRTAASKLQPYQTGDLARVGFLTCLPLREEGVKRIGEGTESCQGMPALYVQSEPKAGNGAFGLECWKAPPSSYGALLLGVRALGKGVKVLGFDLWVDPLPVFVALPLVSDKEGKAAVKMPLSSQSYGAFFVAQAIWFNPSSCPGKGMFSATDALEVHVH